MHEQWASTESRLMTFSFELCVYFFSCFELVSETGGNNNKNNTNSTHYYYKQEGVEGWYGTRAKKKENLQAIFRLKWRQVECFFYMLEWADVREGREREKRKSFAEAHEVEGKKEKQQFFHFIAKFTFSHLFHRRSRSLALAILPKHLSLSSSTDIRSKLKYQKLNAGV